MNMFLLVIVFLSGCTTPCESKLSTTSTLHDLFERLDKEQCLHSDDTNLLQHKLKEYHQKTTLHCDEIWRRSSIDGKLFDGPEELVIRAGSVPDVHIEPDGTHVIVFNNTDPEILLSKTLQDPQIFWRMGLVGFGGLGIALDRMNGSGITYIETDLHLEHPQEVVDPDIGKTPTGEWRLVWFGVNPIDMDKNLTGPINAPKPHYFYRASSFELTNLGNPQIILASDHGSTGGADPAVVTRTDGGETLFLGPLDKTVMAFESKGETWDPKSDPTYNTRVPLASPDVVFEGGIYRMYGMKNGYPGIFELYESSNLQRWTKVGTVLRDSNAFNISVARDPIGVWWIYFNKTNKKCLEKWGSERVLPVEQVGTKILPNAQEKNTNLLPPSLMKDTERTINLNSANISDIPTPEQLQEEELDIDALRTRQRGETLPQDNAQQ